MKKIIIGNNLLPKINQLFDFSRFSTVVILTDTNVAKHWLSTVKKSLKLKTSEIIIKPGEKEKNIETVKMIWKKMFDFGLDRQSLLINLGGGVVCDVGGFAASTFMRGIEFLNIPTTLLAQVDASIGGKVGIDFEEIKNAIGVFKKPTAVIIDIITLKTLPKRELIAAFGEIIKHNVIDSQEHLDLVTAKKPTEFNQKELIEIVKKSVQLKSKIVEKDFKEKIGLRRTLNFGHTIGHAVESLSWTTDNPLLHGEAIAIGMIAESKLAQLMGLLPKNDFLTIEKAIGHAGLPTRLSCHPDVGRDPDTKLIRDILQIMSFDKKNIGKKILFSLPERIGKVAFNVEVPEELIVKAVKHII